MKNCYFLQLRASSLFMSLIETDFRVICHSISHFKKMLVKYSNIIFFKNQHHAKIFERFKAFLGKYLVFG